VDGFFGLQIVSEKTAGEPVQPLVVASHQGGKGRRIPARMPASSSASPTTVMLLAGY